MNTDSEQRFAHRELTERIIGCFYRAYNTLGFGFLESVYHAALQHKLRMAGMVAESQLPITVHSNGVVVGEFRADLVVDGQVLIELKAATTLDRAFEAQVLNYLRATNLEIALLLNFGPKPQVRRLIFDNARKTLSVSSV